MATLIPAVVTNFNPPTPCGVGPALQALQPVNSHFNPPTPCGVGPALKAIFDTAIEFQSTHPVRGGTIALASASRSGMISIHPPRAGWDQAAPAPSMKTGFQSTHPVRGGTLNPPSGSWPRRFQSTHPVRGGTYYYGSYILADLFQSTHPVRGGTPSPAGSLSWQSNFNPPTPCGVGPPQRGGRGVNNFISIHPPRAGWDWCVV